MLTSVNSILNASTALYVCDIHEKCTSAKPNVRKLNAIITITIVLIGLALVLFYAESSSIIETIQQLYGLLSMPILSAFLVCLVFNGVDARAALIAVIFGVLFYGVLFFNVPIHYIHSMFVTFVSCVALSLSLSRFVFGKPATLVGSSA